MSRRVDIVLASICVLFVVEAIFLAPLNADAGYYLRLAHAHAGGAVPCRDVPCYYAPLAAVPLAIGGGEPTASILVMQVALFGCALLTFRLARTLGYDRRRSTRALLLSWALLLANEGRGVVIEPFALVCLLLATSSFASGRRSSSFLLAGLWVALGFWTKQYALLGWGGLLVASLGEGKFRAAAALSAGVVLGLGGGMLLLRIVGVEASGLLGLVSAGAYPNRPLQGNLATAPELVGAALLVLAPLIARGNNEPASSNRSLLGGMLLAALLPLFFRGYRHYWHFAIPFMALLLASPLPPMPLGWARMVRRAASVLLALSIALDLFRCVRDVSSDARSRQRAAAERLTASSSGFARPLYLGDPSLLALVRAPILAPVEVGPRTAAVGPDQARAVLAAADAVVWDTAWPGADELLRRLSADPAAELASRGFVRTRIHGALHVYERGK